MPEVPEQIADSLEHLELQSHTPTPNHPGRMPSMSSQRTYNDPYPTPQSSRPMSEDRASSYHSSVTDDYMSRFNAAEDEPSYSPFPRLVNPGPNIPPTD